jgi:periplasmic protein TonB
MTLAMAGFPRHPIGAAFLAAVAVHALVIFGIAFDLEEHVRYVPPMLDVTLVHSRSETPPEDPDFLAEANQEGGGNLAEQERPTAPAPAPEPAPQPEAAAAPASPPPEPAEAEVVAASEADTARPPPEPVLPAEPVQNTPSAAELYSRSLEIAALTAEVEQAQRAYSQRLRSTYISANTRRHVYAAYMNAWVAKVERVGTINFPDEARRHGLYGDLMLEVALLPDGSVRSIQLLRSSGHRVLDEAAERIVELAAPFAEFPEEIRRETDVLHIVRTWRFLESERLVGR